MGKLMRTLIALLVACSTTLALTAQASTENAVPNEPRESNPAVSSDDSSSDINTAATYPRISALETAILNQTYTNDQLPERLARLEAKAFGKVSSDDDLGERTDLLQQYVERTLHKKWISTDTSSEGEISTNNQVENTQASNQVEDKQASNQVGNNQAQYPRITYLESAILGETFAGDTPVTRLSRLEMNAFGHPSNNSDLSLRTESLEKYADKKLHKKPLLDQESDRQKASQRGQSGSGTTKQFATMLGTTLLGMAGLPIIPSMMPSNQRRQGQSAANQDGAHQAQARNTQAETHQDDPLINAPTAPPATAKLVTKVGWCEMRALGKTHPEMHLQERLSQLNRVLNFAPDKVGLALMDDIPAMIKSVELRKTSISATTDNTY
jgi:hypothetical protein